MVLLRICAEIGLEADYLIKKSFGVSHDDLYDSIHCFFKEVLPWLDIRIGGKVGATFIL